MRKQFKDSSAKQRWLRRKTRIEKHKKTRTARYDTGQKGVSKSRKKAALIVREWPKNRRNLYASYYRKRLYNQSSIEIKLPPELGVEYDLGAFLDFSEALIDLEPQELKLNLEETTFIWPSAIILLTSLKHWFDLTKNSRHPIVSSGKSKSSLVNGYLNHCGFYDYVSRNKDNSEIQFDDSKVVKIVRETSKINIEPRVLETRDLLRKYCSLTAAQLEDFCDSVLCETFINVNEHGINYRGAGWFTLTQYRPTTGLITLCIADNGVGIKNNLLSGPQRNDLLELFKSPDNTNASIDDGPVIEEAMKVNISGAWKASIKKRKYVRRKFDRGQRRGNGLARIKDCCQRLGIKLTIISGKGAIVVDGAKQESFSRNNRVFAGTMYQLTIPANRNL